MASKEYKYNKEQLFASIGAIRVQIDERIRHYLHLCSLESPSQEDLSEIAELELFFIECFPTLKHMEQHVGGKVFGKGMGIGLGRHLQHLNVNDRKDLFKILFNYNEEDKLN